MLQNILIGADIEMFVSNDKGEIITAEPYIKGSKFRPFMWDTDYGIQLDNVMAEFTMPPAKDKDSFINSIKKSVEYIKSQIPQNYKVVGQPTAYLDRMELISESAQTFGCEPDYNAYSLSIQKVERKKANPFMRTAGGHIHVGYDNPTPFKGGKRLFKDERQSIVKNMDALIGVPLILIEPDNERKILYGKAGSFRPKPYGLEYRTPSSYYVEAGLEGWVFDQAVEAAQRVDDKSIAKYWKHCQHAIDNNDKALADYLINKLNIKI